jgi:alkylation response protein AidB-like acyl-CoA dehydrogenase
MYLDFDKKEVAFRTEVRSFLQSKLPADWVGITGGPEALELSAEICRDLAKRGWLTRSWPAEYGGDTASVWEALILEEEFTGHFEPRGGYYIGTDRVGPCIMHYGTPDQKRQFLPPIAAGEVQWVQLFSERDAGSDLASLRTTAHRDGDVFTVNGEKVWTSYANTATHAMLLARTLSGSEGRNGISVLLLDMNWPGIDVREIASPLGWHRIHTVHLNDVRVPADRVLGEIDSGWGVITAFLGLERALTARYARATRVLGMLESIPEAQTNARYRARIAENLAFGRTVETMVCAALDLQVRDGLPRWLASALRIVNGLYEQSIADLAQDMMGAMSRVKGTDPHAKFGGQLEAFVVRQAPTGTITGGAYEIQMSIVARDALGLGRGD